MRHLTTALLCLTACLALACSGHIADADLPKVSATVRIGYLVSDDERTFIEDLKPDDVRKLLAFMESAEKERDKVVKTPSPDHVLLEFRGHRMRCAFDGSWMVDMNDHVEYKFQWYNAPNETPLWKVDRATGKLTFLD